MFEEVFLPELDRHEMKDEQVLQDKNCPFSIRVALQMRFCDQGQIKLEQSKVFGAESQVRSHEMGFVIQKYLRKQQGNAGCKTWLRRMA